MSDKKKINKTESTLAQHKQFKKKLTPPLLTIPQMQPSSWINDRLPEMLWAVLAIGNLERNKALAFFRHVAKYVEEHPECSDVTLTGISKLSEELRKPFLKHVLSWSDDLKGVLRPLLFFPELPGRQDWEDVIVDAPGNEDWNKLVEGVADTLWHQSEAATDCRWVKFLCQILGGKMQFSSAIQGIKDTLQGVLEYPNFGDLKHIRPFIRASEMAQTKPEEPASKWPKDFWKYCFDHTPCMPEEAVNEKIKEHQQQLLNDLKSVRKNYLDQATEIRKKVVTHLIKTSQTSAIDPKHEAVFGLALYGLSVFAEIIFHGISLSIVGRIGVRSLVDVYITMKYLLKKEKTNPEIWDTYREYGIGQLKLLYLKFKESNITASSIDVERLDELANEDKWVEFTPIQLGHWDAENLRKMSEESNTKETYDKYYGYSSGFVHTNWGAVREAIYQRCLNPLHRLHRIPTFDLPLMSSATDDARDLVNRILQCLAEAYPGVGDQFTQPLATDKSGVSGNA